MTQYRYGAATITRLHNNQIHRNRFTPHCFVGGGRNSSPPRDSFCPPYPKTHTRHDIFYTVCSIIRDDVAVQQSSMIIYNTKWNKNVSIIAYHNDIITITLCLHVGTGNTTGVARSKFECVRVRLPRTPAIFYFLRSWKRHKPDIECAEASSILYFLSAARVRLLLLLQYG